MCKLHTVPNCAADGCTHHARFGSKWCCEEHEPNHHFREIVRKREKYKRERNLAVTSFIIGGLWTILALYLMTKSM